MVTSMESEDTHNWTRFEQAPIGSHPVNVVRAAPWTACGLRMPIAAPG
jgi:hypothetical protein